MVAVSIAACLFVCLLGLYQRTRSIEYKYMRLVQNNQNSQQQDNEEELPIAETCALEEEEDDDEVCKFLCGFHMEVEL